MCVVNRAPTHTPERSGLLNECAAGVIATATEGKRRKAREDEEGGGERGGSYVHTAGRFFAG